MQPDTPQGPTVPRKHQHTAGVVIVGTIALRGGSRPRFDTVMTALTAGTRAEAGCLGFSWGPTPDDDLRILVQEEYVGVDALESHQRQPHVAAYAAALPDLLAEPVTFRVYTTAGMRPFTLTPSSGASA